jgi:hypothetical protein
MAYNEQDWFVLKPTKDGSSNTGSQSDRNLNYHNQRVSQNIISGGPSSDRIIAKVKIPAPEGGIPRLEPCAGKLASTVLRGGRPGNGSLLPDFLLSVRVHNIVNKF